MNKAVYINIPVKDLAAATRFYEAIGCVLNPQFSDENSASMVWSDTATFMLHNHGYYSTFTPKPIADASATSAMIIALAMDSREAVDEITAAAGAAGGRSNVRPPADMGFMYQRTFEDPDGNLFEPVSFNMSAEAG